MSVSGFDQQTMTTWTHLNRPGRAYLRYAWLGLLVSLLGFRASAEVPASEPSTFSPLLSNPGFLAIASNHSVASAEPSPQQKGLLRIYRSNMLKKTYQHIVYPESAINNNHEGEVVLRVIVDRSGKVQHIDYDKRANYNSLNKAAKKALQRAKPFPAVPQRLEGESFELLMPIRFRLAG